MARATAPRTAVERLAQELFDSNSEDPIAGEVATWLADSRRFHAFARAHRDKIRKKLRGASDAEARRDVRAELRAAHLLLGDRRIELAFEAYGSGKGGPDFTVTFRGERSFNLEVTRLRRAADAPGDGGWLLTKLRQLPPSVPNAVVVATMGESAEAFGIAGVMRSLRERAEANDDVFLASRGLEGTRGFNQRFRRLATVLVWCEGAAGEARAASWTNPSARFALPERVARACLQCFRAG